MMEIYARTLNEHEEHECGYPTCGDWDWHNDKMFVTVDRMDEASEFAVMIHEMVEGFLCRQHGITSNDVSSFDRIFENETVMGAHMKDDEPGADPRSPYRKEHEIATLIEMIVLRELGKAWPEHCKAVAA
jgi:hypothetical protein